MHISFPVQFSGTYPSRKKMVDKPSIIMLDDDVKKIEGKEVVCWAASSRNEEKK
jgi:hypothetical protein